MRGVFTSPKVTPRNTLGEMMKNINTNSIAITPTLTSIINGALLGDWSLTKSSESSARFDTSSKYRLFLEWASQILGENGIDSGNIYHKTITFKNGYGPYDSYRLKSYSYSDLLRIRELWYPEGKKIVPAKLTLDKATVLWWYLGDGNLDCGKTRNPRIRLFTNGFRDNDVDRLAKMLIAIGIKAWRTKTENIISVSSYSTPAFLEYIGPCPKAIESVYGYKWDLDRRGPVGLYNKR